MPFKTVTPALDEGWYIMQLEQFADTHGDYGDGMRWEFTVQREDTGEQVLDERSGEPYVFFAYTSTATGPKSRARPWLEALLGTPMPAAPMVEELQAIVEGVIGRKARVLVTIGDKGYSQIQTMRALRPRPVASRNAPPPPSDDDLPY